MLALQCLLLTCLFVAQGKKSSYMILADGSPLQLNQLFRTVANGYGISFDGWNEDTPCQLQVVKANHTFYWTSAAYDTVQELTDPAAGFEAECTVSSVGGSEFHLKDVFRPAARISTNGFKFSRSITVLKKGPYEVAFSSRFSLADPAHLQATGAFVDREFFMPGVWYLDGRGMSPNEAIAADVGSSAVLVREDRLPYPLVLTRNPESNKVAVLSHEHRDGSTFANEGGTETIIDGRMQFGSIGALNAAGMLKLQFQFPGSEGDRTYVKDANGSTDCEDQNCWAYRHHPIDINVIHNYSLQFYTKQEPTYEDAMRNAWLHAYYTSKPQAPTLSPADLQQVYRDSIDLLSNMAEFWNGVPSMPFSVRLDDGVAEDHSSQMGFIGSATPAAALLLRDAANTKSTRNYQKAVAIIDFWVEKSMTDSPQPQTWFDPDFDKMGDVLWRRGPLYHGHIRIACEGVLGILRAWQIHPQRKSWLDYARKYGDFLVSKQDPAGDFGSQFDEQGNIVGRIKTVAHIPIPLLVALYHATGLQRYKEAAILAGEYTTEHVSKNMRYLGGTCDNPDVLDRETAVYAMHAFLELYDLTRNARWIGYAEDAAFFSATWTYIWDVPIPADSKCEYVNPINGSVTLEAVAYPPNRTTLGAALIALGHSHVDNFMAKTVGHYHKLSEIGSEPWRPFFASFSAFLRSATKQVLDWDGSLGYLYPGLIGEAASLADNRGCGVRRWLPWLTVNMLEGIVWNYEKGNIILDEVPSYAYVRTSGLCANPTGHENQFHAQTIPAVSEHECQMRCNDIYNCFAYQYESKGNCSTHTQLGLAGSGTWAEGLCNMRIPERRIYEEQACATPPEASWKMMGNVSSPVCAAMCDAIANCALYMVHGDTGCLLAINEIAADTNGPIWEVKGRMCSQKGSIDDNSFIRNWRLSSPHGASCDEVCRSAGFTCRPDAFSTNRTAKQAKSFFAAAGINCSVVRETSSRGTPLVHMDDLDIDGRNARLCQYGKEASGCSHAAELTQHRLCPCHGAAYGSVLDSSR